MSTEYGEVRSTKHSQWIARAYFRPRINRRPFADDIFKCIFLNENEWILPRISLKFVARVRINNIPALVHIMAWRRKGDKPLSEPMMVSLPTHICVARPQWFKVGHFAPVSPFWPKEVSLCPNLYAMLYSLQWRHNERDGVSNHQHHDWLLNCLFGRRSKKTSKIHVTGLYAGNSPVNGEPAQRACNAENVSISWRHRVRFRLDKTHRVNYMYHVCLS